MAVEEIGTRKEIVEVMTDVEETNTKKAEIGLALSAIIPISHSERSVTAVKQISPVMAPASLRENLTEVEIIPKNLEIGLALSVTTRTFLLEISAIDVKHIDPVLEINLHPEVDVIKIVVLDPKEDPPHAEGEGHLAALVNHVDLDSEVLAEVLLGVIDQVEAAVGAEFETPQHSFCLNPSNTYGEQGGYALGRSSRA